MATSDLSLILTVQPTGLGPEGPESGDITDTKRCNYQMFPVMQTELLSFNHITPYVMKLYVRGKYAGMLIALF